MAHWPVPRLRGLHPSMTKFDGALRSGCSRRRREPQRTVFAAYQPSVLRRPDPVNDRSRMCSRLDVRQAQ